MGTGIKPVLFEKILSKSINKYRFFKNLENTCISHKHNKNFFTASFDKSCKSDSKSDLVTIEVNRNILMKNVLESIKNEKLLHLDVKPKTVVIDFSSPNIAKPFHVGHLRSTIIGNFIANINKYYHNNVIKLNYLGDWGTQFGLLQYGLHMKKIQASELKDNPIKNLYDIYVETNKLSCNDESIQNKARKYFTDIEQGNSRLDNWIMIRDVTINELKNIYNRLGITFDHYHWESNYNAEAIKDVILELQRSNIIINDDSGKKVAKVNNRDVAVLKSDNSTLYLTRDIAALLDRYNKFKFDKMMYVVDNSQTDHFTALFDIVGRLNKQCINGCEHIKFGRIRGMSTRKGNVVFLNDILDEAKSKMYDKQLQSKNTRSTAMNDETCEILGTTAVIINDLKQRRQRDYVFDWNKALQSEGDSGVKLQYLHCRLWSLEKNCGISLPEYCEPEHLSEEIAGLVASELIKFEDVLYRAYIESEACIIVNYLFRLAKYVNKMFNELRVKNIDSSIGAQRLLLFHSARLVLKTSLEILGVKPLYEM